MKQLCGFVLSYYEIVNLIEFIGTCVHLRGDDINDFDDSSRSIVNSTFRKHLGNKYLWFERSLGYNRDLRLANDLHVSYCKGIWEGRKAVCCYWSMIHHIFVIE